MPPNTQPTMHRRQRFYPNYLCLIQAQSNALFVPPRQFVSVDVSGRVSSPSGEGIMNRADETFYRLQEATACALSMR